MLTSLMGIVIKLFRYALSSFVLSVLWRWFIVKKFPTVPELEAADFFGIQLMLFIASPGTIWRMYPHEPGGETTASKLRRELGMTLYVIPFIFGVAFLLHLLFVHR